jgi:hypothetical protein
MKGKIEMVVCRRIRISTIIQSLIIVSLILVVFPAVGFVGEARAAGKRTAPEPGWSTFFGGGYVHQFKTDMDDGGRFSSDRLAIRGGVTYASDYRRSASLALGYGFDRYDFSGNSGFAALRPWKHINSYRMSAPVRAGFKEAWTVFLIPTLQFFAESGADLGDALRGGGFVGISYRFGDRLTLGPGIGVMSQIEDSASVFPVLIVKWKITDRLNLETGRGLGATLGPGLVLRWEASDKWDLAVGGRFEKLRFRLDDNGIAPKGVGQDRAFPLFFGVSYRFSRRAQVSLLGGAELGGKLRLEDKKGNLIAKDDYETAGFGGMTFNVRF